MSSAASASDSMGNQHSTSPAPGARVSSPATSAPAVKPAAPHSLAEWLALLTPEQQRAVKGIMDGKNSDEVAADAGVSRNMLRHWRLDDPMFMATLAAWRRETIEKTRAAVWNELVPLARQLVERVVREKKPKGRRRSG